MRDRNSDRTNDKTVLPEMDFDLTDKSERVFERLIQDEGFSEEQALSIAMADVGEHGGDIDLDGDEDELTLHEEEPIRIDLTDEDGSSAELSSIDS